MNLNISQNTIDEAKTPRNLSLAICLSDPTSTSTKPATNVNIQKNFKNINKKKLSIKSKHEFKNNTNLIAKPNLRKKICLKLAKNLQNIYSVEKNGSQKLSLTIESKIRNQFPLMNLEYKGEIKLIFQLLKVFFNLFSFCLIEKF